MPIHSHERAKRLKPERMRQPAEELVASGMVNDRFAEQRAELCHAIGEPSRNVAAVEGQIGAAGPSHGARFSAGFSSFLFCSQRCEKSTASVPSDAGGPLVQRALFVA